MTFYLLNDPSLKHLALTIFSDTHEELLLPNKPAVANNPGSRYLVKKEEAINPNRSEQSRVKMLSVTLEDILQFSSGSSFILKLDIQGFD